MSLTSSPQYQYLQSPNQFPAPAPPPAPPAPLADDGDRAKPIELTVVLKYIGDTEEEKMLLHVDVAVSRLIETIYETFGDRIPEGIDIEDLNVWPLRFNGLPLANTDVLQDYPQMESGATLEFIVDGEADYQPMLEELEELLKLVNERYTKALRSNNTEQANSLKEERTKIQTKIVQLRMETT